MSELELYDQAPSTDIRSIMKHSWESAKLLLDKFLVCGLIRDSDLSEIKLNAVGVIK